MSDLGKTLSDYYKCEVREVIQGGHVRALEVRMRSGVSIDQDALTNLSALAGNREIMINMKHPDKPHVLVSAIPAKPKQHKMHKICVKPEGSNPKLVRLLFELWDGITVKENMSCGHVEMHVFKVRKLFVNKTVKMLRPHNCTLKIMPTGVVVVMQRENTRKRKRE